MLMRIEAPIVRQAEPRAETIQAKQRNAAADKDDLALRKVCREFESLLVAQMLKKMRDTVPKADLFGSSEKEEMFQSMLDDELAKGYSEASGLGLGDLIYEQLTGQKIAKVPARPVDR